MSDIVAFNVRGSSMSYAVSSEEGDFALAVVRALRRPPTMRGDVDTHLEILEWAGRTMPPADLERLARVAAALAGER